MLEREEQPLEANTDQTQDVDRECLNDHVNWSIICMSGCIIKCLYGRLKKQLIQIQHVSFPRVTNRKIIAIIE